MIRYESTYIYKLVISCGKWDVDVDGTRSKRSIDAK